MEVTRNEGLDKNASNRDMLRKDCQFEETGSIVIGVIISVYYMWVLVGMNCNPLGSWRSCSCLQVLGRFQ